MKQHWLSFGKLGISFLNPENWNFARLSPSLICHLADTNAPSLGHVVWVF